MLTRYLISTAALLTLVGCSPAAAVPQGLPTAELMTHVIDPAADGVWERQGWEVTAEGERENFPTSDAQWLEAINASATVAETASLLLTPAHRRPGGEWTQSANALHTAGLEAFAAAEAHDKAAFFSAGERIYAACTACHETYLPAPAEPPAPPPSRP